MRTIFNLLVTMFVIGAIWHLIVKIIDEVWHNGYLDAAWYVPPDLCVGVSFLGLVVYGLIALWR